MRNEMKISMCVKMRGLKHNISGFLGVKSPPPKKDERTKNTYVRAEISRFFFKFCHKLKNREWSELAATKQCRNQLELSGQEKILIWRLRTRRSQEVGFGYEKLIQPVS